MNVDGLKDRKIYCLKARPQDLQAGAVKGLSAFMETFGVSLTRFVCLPSERLYPLVAHRRDLFGSQWSGMGATKLQALVYDILPSTTAVFSYAIGSRKLSANEQFFVRAQTVLSLLQTTQIKQGVSFIAANKVYASTNKTTIV